MGSEKPAEAADVWRLIQRADEFLKYSPNRDPATARAQARESLDKASEAAGTLADAAAAEQFREQIRLRLQDLERLEGSS